MKKTKENKNGQGYKLYFALGLVLAIFLTVWLGGCNSKKISRSSDTLADPAKDFNVVVPISHDIGNINAVPQKELDNLFGNIKQ